MSDFILIAISGIGLGALYFLLSSGLSLIFGLMRVLSFAHGVFLTLSAYAAWRFLGNGPVSDGHLVLAAIIACLAGALVAFLTQVVVLRRLQGRELEQLLATVGIGTAGVALITGIWGPTTKLVNLPQSLSGTVDIGGAPIPRTTVLLVVAAVLVLSLIQVLLKYSRYGLIVRAGVENREMVRALGIDVGSAFTLVFTFGGALAGFAGVLAAVSFKGVYPTMGDQMLIYGFITLIIGGLGSIAGAAMAAALLGVCQSLANFYIGDGIGDIFVVLLLILVLIVRPQGIRGSKVRLL